jgi:hypothetical protein
MKKYSKSYSIIEDGKVSIVHGECLEIKENGQIIIYKEKRGSESNIVAVVPKTATILVTEH